MTNLVNLKSIIINLILFTFSLFSVNGQPTVDELKKTVRAYPDSTRLYLEIAKQYLFNTPDSAHLYILEAINSGDRQHHTSIKAEAFKFLGIWHDLQSAYDSAIYYYSMAGALYEGDSQGEGYADVLNNIAYSKSKQGNYSQALEDYYQALEAYQEMGAMGKVSRTLINIGTIFQQTDDLDQAMEMYQSALKSAESLEDGQKTYLVASSNIATIHSRRGEYPEAIAIYDTLISIFTVGNDDRGLSLNYNNRAQAYVKVREYDRAKASYVKSIEIKRRMNDRQGLANAYKNVAELHLDMNDFINAKKYIDSSLLISRELQDLNLFTDGKRVASLIHANADQHKEASGLFIEYIQLRDSLEAVEHAKMVQELSNKYEAEKKEKRIMELELDKQHAALALVKSENQRNVLVSGLLLIFIFSGFLYYNYRTKKRTSELLTIKNEQISLALDERETLLKEIHHRVKNNLQVISSLLNLQAGSLADEAAIDAVKEGQNRVKSMALIHQKLYSTDDIRGVDVQDYLENLTSELFSAFGVDEEKVRYEVETSGLKLDIDTVIPLGLIINELITNTIKYAFEKSEAGLLRIQMKEEDGKLNVFVKDNGVGMGEEAMQNSNSFGWKMIKSLSRKLKAEIIITNHEGTTVQLALSRYKLV